MGRTNEVVMVDFGYADNWYASVNGSRQMFARWVGWILYEVQINKLLSTDQPIGLADV